MKIGGSEFAVTIARTEAERQKGLSSTERLPDGSAMLFVFPSDAKWGIWMKDMRYAIDILWLDADKKIVHLVHDARPDSYPETTFEPASDSRYVIELPSGTIKAAGLAKGMSATFASDS